MVIVQLSDAGLIELAKVVEMFEDAEEMAGQKRRAIALGAIHKLIKEFTKNDPANC